MVDMALIGGLANSLNVALNISKAMLGIRDQALIQEKIIELTSEIISAQQAGVAAIVAQTELTERIRTLEKQVADFEKWETEKQWYDLKQVDVGAFAYSLKPDAPGTEVPHWICTTCYQNRKISIFLQQALRIRSPGEQRDIWVCPVCSTKIGVSPGVHPGQVVS
jgi:hypothetical protein